MQWTIGIISPAEREVEDRKKKRVDGKTCQRCLEPLTTGKCQVPHPPHLLEDGFAMSGAGAGGGLQKISHCRACGKSFTTLHKSNTAPVVIKGPKFCWLGKHRKMALTCGDERCINTEIASFKVDADLQANIDETLSGEKQKEVYFFNICSDGFYDEEITASLCHPMSNLTTVKLTDVNITKLHLTEELTPNVTEVECQNLPSDCDFKVLLPKLKSVNFCHYTPDDDGEGVNNMLQAATKLESFTAHKMWVGGQLNFASNDLKTITLTRADFLQSITVWAPKLKQLNLMSCHDIQHIEIQKEHATLSKELPKSHKMTTFSINLSRALLGPVAIQNLKDSGRCVVPPGAGECNMDF